MDLATLMDWLRAPEVSLDVYTARESLGVVLGSADWYQKDATLAELVRNPALEAGFLQVSSEDEFPGWLYSVLDAYRYDEPVWDENYQMYYRYDSLTGVYEWAADLSSGEWLTQEQADSLGRGNGQASAMSCPSAPQWDPNWEMFYRLSARGVYQYAHAETPFVQTSGCPDREDAWMSYEDASSTYDEWVRTYKVSAPAAEAAPAGEAGPPEPPAAANGNQADNAGGPLQSGAQPGNGTELDFMLGDSGTEMVNELLNAYRSLQADALEAAQSAGLISHLVTAEQWLRYVEEQALGEVVTG